ncbi:MAG: acyl-CoA thioesterase [Alistipes sp.]|nr:acyl-CoA thioesterase [Alistipes sp.]
MLTCDVKIRVWYKHTDQMGFVHHSNYICYYEEARSAFMREYGVSYARMEAEGVLMPILHIESDYRRPAFYDDELTVRVLIREVPRVRFTVDYEVYNSQGELLNTGRTTLGFLRKESMRPCRAPQWFADLIRANGGEE